MQDTNAKQNSKKDFVNNVFNSVFKKYDLMNDIMSFGIHRLWKENLIDWLQPKLNSKLSIRLSIEIKGICFSIL